MEELHWRGLLVQEDLTSSHKMIAFYKESKKESPFPVSVLFVLDGFGVWEQ